MLEDGDVARGAAAVDGLIPRWLIRTSAIGAAALSLGGVLAAGSTQKPDESSRSTALIRGAEGVGHPGQPRSALLLLFAAILFDALRNASSVSEPPRLLVRRCGRPHRGPCGTRRNLRGPRRIDRTADGVGVSGRKCVQRGDRLRRRWGGSESRPRRRTRSRRLRGVPGTPHLDRCRGVPDDASSQGRVREPRSGEVAAIG